METRDYTTINEASIETEDYSISDEVSMETERAITSEVIEIAESFDRLDGKKQLELIGILLEKMANGEVEVKGHPIYPEEVGIDDSFACCTIIMNMLYR